MHRVTKVEHCTEQEINEFFQEDWEMKKVLEDEQTRENGYFMEFGEEKLCFFVIEPIADNHAWLKQVLMMRSNAKLSVFLLVFDWIAEEAEKQGYESLIVSVNDQVRADLLELIQFKKIYYTPVEQDVTGDWYEKRLKPAEQRT